MEKNIKVSYVTTLPLEGDGPSVIIEEKTSKRYIIEYIDKKDFSLVKKDVVLSNNYSYGRRQWYTDWLINIYDENGSLIHSDNFNLENKYVFIKIDGRALGDNLAWVPYIDEFRKRHKCHVFCSTFFNDIFKYVYPDIMFVEPNTVINNIYAQYYIGSHTGNRIYSPNDYKVIPLQQTATDILGMEYYEIKSDIMKSISNTRRSIIGNYVCISEKASTPKKEWCEGTFGWQLIVDVLQHFGYNVVVISKEPTELKNVINLTGDVPLKQRMIDLFHAKLFIGVSSGLSWLSWSVDTPVMLISDVTPSYHEFKSGVARIGGENQKSVDYDEYEKSDIHKVLMSLRKVLGVD